MRCSGHAPGHLSALALAVYLPLLAGCGVRGSGVMATQTRDVSGFSEISLSGSGEVLVEQTGRESLTIEAEDNLLPLLETYVDGDTLVLRTRPDTSISPTRTIRYRITVARLDAARISGSGSLRAAGLDSDRFTTSISGSGSMTLAGKAKAIDLSISGSGSYDAADLVSQTGRVSISGSGSGVVNTSEELEVAISGSGSIEVIGKPWVDQHISGSGRITRRKPA
jgi:Putative auto-transporter adhesin, head GIN domain